MRFRPKNNILVIVRLASDLFRVSATLSHLVFPLLTNVINLVPYRPVPASMSRTGAKRYMLHYVPFRPRYRSGPAVPVSSGHFPDLVRNIKRRFREEEDDEKKEGEEEEKKKRRGRESRTSFVGVRRSPMAAATVENDEIGRAHV